MKRLGSRRRRLTGELRGAGLQRPVRECRRGLVAALFAVWGWAGAEDDFGVGVCDAESEPEGSQEAVEFGRVVARDTQLVVGCPGQVEHLTDRTERAAHGCEPVC